MSEATETPKTAEELAKEEIKGLRKRLDEKNDELATRDKQLSTKDYRICALERELERVKAEASEVKGLTSGYSNDAQVARAAAAEAKKAQEKAESALAPIKSELAGQSRKLHDTQKELDRAKATIELLERQIRDGRSKLDASLSTAQMMQIARDSAQREKVAAETRELITRDKVAGLESRIKDLETARDNALNTIQELHKAMKNRVIGPEHVQVKT